MDLKSFSAVQPAGRTGSGRLICTDADAMMFVAGWVEDEPLAKKY
jgi:hypothetical protein